MRSHIWNNHKVSLILIILTIFVSSLDLFMDSNRPLRHGLVGSLLFSSPFILIYVDDILVIGTSNNDVNAIIHSLSREFSVKNLGYPRYFFGVELITTINGILLH